MGACSLTEISLNDVRTDADWLAPAPPPPPETEPLRSGFTLAAASDVSPPPLQTAATAAAAAPAACGSRPPPPSAPLPLASSRSMRGSTYLYSPKSYVKEAVLLRAALRAAAALVLPPLGSRTHRVRRG